MNPTTFSVLSALAAAVWTAWTWKSERVTERQLKRDEMAAHYTNSLIITMQVLQKHLNRILETDELTHCRKKEAQEPASPAAIDLLYIISMFFGWEYITFRFGQYTRDPRVLSMFEEIGETLESRTICAGDAFRFSVADRVALGLAVLHPAGEMSSKPIFISVPRYKFEDDISNPKSEHASLYRSDVVRSSLGAVDRAVAGETLEARERLLILQKQLAGLLTYLEIKEGFRTPPSPIKSSLAIAQAFLNKNSEHSNNQVQVLHQTPGRIRLKVPRVQADDEYATELQLLLRSANKVRNVRINRAAASVTVEFSEELPSATMLQAIMPKLEGEVQSIPSTAKIESAPRRASAEAGSLRN
jgi:hypothetical protein